MKNEFSLAFNEVLEEKQRPKEVILGALESAMVSAYRRAVNASSAQHVEAKGWTEPMLEFYLNNKVDFKTDRWERCSAA